MKKGAIFIALLLLITVIPIYQQGGRCSHHAARTGKAHLTSLLGRYGKCQTMRRTVFKFQWT